MKTPPTSSIKLYSDQLVDISIQYQTLLCPSLKITRYSTTTPKNSVLSSTPPPHSTLFTYAVSNDKASIASSPSSPKNTQTSPTHSPPARFYKLREIHEQGNSEQLVDEDSPFSERKPFHIVPTKRQNNELELDNQTLIPQNQTTQQPKPKYHEESSARDELSQQKDQRLESKNYTNYSQEAFDTYTSTTEYNKEEPTYSNEITTYQIAERTQLCPQLLPRINPYYDPTKPKKTSFIGIFMRKQQPSGAARPSNSPKSRRQGANQSPSRSRIDPPLSELIDRIGRELKYFDLMRITIQELQELDEAQLQILNKVAEEKVRALSVKLKMMKAEKQYIDLNTKRKKILENRAKIQQQRTIVNKLITIKNKISIDYEYQLTKRIAEYQESISLVSKSIRSLKIQIEKNDNVFIKAEETGGLLQKIAELKWECVSEIKKLSKKQTIMDRITERIKYYEKQLSLLPEVVVASPQKQRTSVIQRRKNNSMVTRTPVRQRIITQNPSEAKFPKSCSADRRLQITGVDSTASPVKKQKFSLQRRALSMKQKGKIDVDLEQPTEQAACKQTIYLIGVNRPQDSEDSGQSTVVLPELANNQYCREQLTDKISILEQEVNQDKSIQTEVAKLQIHSILQEKMRLEEIKEEGILESERRSQLSTIHQKLECQVVDTARNPKQQINPRIAAAQKNNTSLDTNSPPKQEISLKPSESPQEVVFKKPFFVKRNRINPSESNVLSHTDTDIPQTSLSPERRFKTEEITQQETPTRFRQIPETPLVVITQSRTKMLKRKPRREVRVLTNSSRADLDSLDLNDVEEVQLQSPSKHVQFDFPDQL